MSSPSPPIKMPITSRMARAKFCLAREKLDENAITRTVMRFTKGMTMRSTTATQLGDAVATRVLQRWDGNRPAAGSYLTIFMFGCTGSG